MLRHQDVPDDFKIEFAAQFVQGLHKPPLEAFRVEEASAAVGAARQVMEMIETVKMLLPWHSAIIGSLSAAYIAKNATYAPPAARFRCRGFLFVPLKNPRHKKRDVATCSRCLGPHTCDNAACMRHPRYKTHVAAARLWVQFQGELRKKREEEEKKKPRRPLSEAP